MNNNSIESVQSFSFRPEHFEKNETSEIVSQKGIQEVHETRNKIASIISDVLKEPPFPGKFFDQGKKLVSHCLDEIQKSMIFNFSKGMILLRAEKGQEPMKGRTGSKLGISRCLRLKYLPLSFWRKGQESIQRMSDSVIEKCVRDFSFQGKEKEISCFTRLKRKILTILFLSKAKEIVKTQLVLVEKAVLRVWERIEVQFLEYPRVRVELVPEQLWEKFETSFNEL